MGSRGRQRGEREPTGRTKLAILLYLADHGECTFTQIRSHLQERYNIKSTKDVKIHLNDLTSDDRLGLIAKVPHGNGNANSYHIREGFNSLKKLHNYLGSLSAVPALMKTAYFRDYTASIDFETKVRTNIVRNSMLELYDGILDDRGYENIKSALANIDRVDREAMISWMDRIRESDRTDTLSGSFLAMVDLLKEGDIDRLGNIFTDIVRLMRTEKTGVMRSEFFALMSELSFPESQRELVYATRRLSPGTLGYLLNSSKNNRIFTPNIFLAYVFSLILQMPGENDVPDSLPSIDIGRYRRYAANVPQISSVSPIVLVSRSLFIADMIQGRLVVDEVPEETLRLVFA
jgi:hypothetical protein